MEGIHLRGGKVARGGLRWSDRPDDFRTEVLGLMKTHRITSYNVCYTKLLRPFSVNFVCSSDCKERVRAGFV